MIRRPPFRLVLGVALPMALALGYYALGVWATRFGHSFPVFFTLITGPIATGFLFYSLTRPLFSPGHWDYLIQSLWIPGIAVAVLLVAQFETVLCIAMALPLYVPLQFAGIFLAIRLFRDDRRSDAPNTLRASLALLPLLGLPLELSHQPAPQWHSVTTVVDIAAPAATVWRHTVEIPRIDASELPATFSHSILRSPRPVSARLDGSTRHLEWTHGVRFEEHITAAHPNRSLAWTFHFPDLHSLRAVDPHIRPDGPLVTLSHGSYQLDPLGPRRTRLTLTTHYRLATPLAPYLRLWGSRFLQDFHRSVLTVIATRSESPS